jgi:hypothetical protein
VTLAEPSKLNMLGNVAKSLAVKGDQPLECGKPGCSRPLPLWD